MKSIGTDFLDLCLPPEAGAAEMTRLARLREPFLFVIDAWAGRWFVVRAAEAEGLGILWDLDGRGPMGPPRIPPADFRFHAVPPSRETYARGFDTVRRGQVAGETYLANLTFPSRLDTDLDLETLALTARARFRILVPGIFTSFSPERFIRISRGGRIESFPMKGTIDASLPDAAEMILSDAKEAAEHVTIVDLIRNDIGRSADHVEVPRYRFITEAAGRDRRLLQVSSEVAGELGESWRDRLGGVMASLLPAGSVTGAPKKRTCEIIREAEGYDRNWYAGVFGYCDGLGLDSAVTIRYIETGPGGTLVYKSGGGITIYSEMESEYAELEAKIYAPSG